MLLNPNIKAVIIALPIAYQAEYIRKALRAGKSVLSEKPVAKDVGEARGLVEWWRKGGEGGMEVDCGRVSWCVAENWRWVDSLRFAGQECARLGKVLGFRVKVGSKMGPGNKYFGESTLGEVSRCVIVLLPCPPERLVGVDMRDDFDRSCRYSLASGTRASRRLRARQRNSLRRGAALASRRGQCHHASRSLHSAAATTSPTDRYHQRDAEDEERYQRNFRHIGGNNVQRRRLCYCVRRWYRDGRP